MSALTTFVNNLAILQRNWNEENSQIVHHWKHAQEEWKKEKEIIFEQIKVMQLAANDERLCFINELDRLSTEKVDRDELVSSLEKRVLDSEETCFKQAQVIDELKMEKEELLKQVEVLTNCMDEKIKLRLNEYQTQWDIERMKFLDKIWKMELVLDKNKPPSETNESL